MAKTTIRLRGTDAALVLREDGTTTAVIPDGAPGTVVPDHIVFLMALAHRMDADPDFCQEIVDAMKAECWPQGVGMQPLQ